MEVWILDIIGGLLLNIHDEHKSPLFVDIFYENNLRITTSVPRSTKHILSLLSISWNSLADLLMLTFF